MARRRLPWVGLGRHRQQRPQVRVCTTVVSNLAEAVIIEKGDALLRAGTPVGLAFATWFQGVGSRHRMHGAGGVEPPRVSQAATGLAR